MSTRDLSRFDDQAIALLRRGKTGSEDWIYVAGALLRKIDALEARVKELEGMVEDVPEASEGGAAA